MATERTDNNEDPKREADRVPERRTIPASEVGLSLTLSEETLKEFDRIQAETIRAAEKDQNFSWR